MLSLHNAHHTQCTFSTRNDEFPNIHATSKTHDKTSNRKMLDMTFTRLTHGLLHKTEFDAEVRNSLTDSADIECHGTAEACGLTGMIRRLDAMTVPCAHTIQPMPCTLCFVHVIALCCHHSWASADVRLCNLTPLQLTLPFTQSSYTNTRHTRQTRVPPRKGRTV